MFSKHNMLQNKLLENKEREREIKVKNYPDSWR